MLLKANFILKILIDEFKFGGISHMKVEFIPFFERFAGEDYLLQLDVLNCSNGKKDIF